MRVVHIVPTAFGDKGVVGGAERYAFELARSMSEHVPTTLVVFGQDAGETEVARLRIRTLRPSWYVKGQNSNPIAASLVGEVLKADVVHCHQQHIAASSLASLVCRLSGRKVFVSDLGGGGWDLSSYICTDRWYHGHLHISEYSRTVFGHAAKPWAHVVYGGVDIEKFSPGESRTRNGSVLFVGRLMPHKGIDDLIRALPPRMELQIIGRPYHPRYLEDLRRLAQGKRVVFRQDCDDQAIVEAYRQALCVVLPSVYRTMYGDKTQVPELLGQTLLEAMACGTPAICTDVASMPEVVRDQITGFVVPPNDPLCLREKLLWLRDHPDETGRMGEAAREHVASRFTWPTVVRKCLKIYRAEAA